MREAAKNSKNEKSAQFKAANVLRKWLSSGDDKPTGMFRDPVRR